jgi:hypothetical protein
MKNAFPFPLPEEALRMACHLHDWHELHEPRHRDGLVYAGNGFLAIRVRKGHWIDDELEPMQAVQAARFDSLPWGRLDALIQSGREWVELLKGFRPSANSTLWHHRSGRFNRKPAARVRRAVIPLSILEFLARFPRVEVNLDSTSEREPLYFRFAGGEGIVPPFRRPPEAEREIFKPRYDALGGHEIRKKDLRPLCKVKPPAPLPDFPDL